ncbi:cytochrome P450 [Rostrohypoxylon terebratum]|nr:cytochrome P450 [Rostrohypoxylon terebratum]
MLTKVMELESILTQWHSAFKALALVASLFVLLPAVVLTVSTMSFKTTTNQNNGQRQIPTVPYMIPFLYHAGPLIRSPVQFITNTLENYGWQRPLRVRAGWLGFTIIANPSYIQTVFKSSKQLTSKPAVLLSLKYLLNSPASSISFYAADNSGIASVPRKGSNIEHHNRIHFHQAHTVQEFLSGQHLTHLGNRYLDTLQRNLSSLFSTGSSDWIEYPDLYHFLQTHAMRSAVETVMGSKIFEMSPTLIDDFWEFDGSVPRLLRGFPRWLMPGPYKARDRLHDAIKKWHAYAHAHSDCSKTSNEDPEWEPYFGSKLIRARQNYLLKMEPINADARASEDVGLMMASNGNAVPSIFWLIYEALRDQDLQKRMLAEVTSCTGSEKLDITKLTSQPLLQSVYAEVLRLRIAIGMTRVSETESFNLDGYQIQEGEPLVIFSRPAAFNQEVWARVGRPASEREPLDEFYAERFLVPKGSSTGSGHQQKQEQEHKTNPSTMTAPASSNEYEFSLDGLAGSWIPYGGGQRMCPGRHLAKGEMIGTFAVLFTQYDIELLAPDSPKVESDLRWFPAGALPPVSKVPFRLRPKQRQI